MYSGSITAANLLSESALWLRQSSQTSTVATDEVVLRNREIPVHREPPSTPGGP